MTALQRVIRAAWIVAAVLFVAALVATAADGTKRCWIYAECLGGLT